MLVNPADLSLEDAMHYNELLAGRIYLGDDIGPYIARDVIRDMEFALSIAETTPALTLYINSPGGGFYDAISVYDFILSLRKTTPVKGVVRGQAASAASMLILQATAPRVATPHSRLLLHELRKLAFGPEAASSVQDNAEELARLHTIIFGIIAERSGKEVDDIRAELTRREVWLSATEALEWGLIDMVID